MPSPRHPTRTTTTAAVVVACCGLLLATLPMFLVSSLAVDIRGELGFSEAALGAAISGAFATAALAAPLGGRLADRLGVRAAVLGGGALSVVALGGIALGARSWAHLAVLLVLAGVGVAVIDPGLAVLVTRGVASTRQGLAFGLKEASIPAAGLLAGVALPTIAVTMGWRWAFAVGVLPLAGLLAALPRIRTDAVAEPAAPASTSHEAPAPPRGPLLLTTVAAALGITAASGVGVFVTESAVAMGLSASSAGLLLAAGSGAGIAARIVTGMLADRAGGGQMGLISWMLAVGALAMACGVTGAAPLLVVGTIGAYAGGWGWSGLLFLSLVRAAPAAPGAAAGLGIAGLATGTALGPVLFGTVAQAESFETAWAVAAGTAAVAAILMRLADRRLPDRRLPDRRSTDEADEHRRGQAI